MNIASTEAGPHKHAVKHAYKEELGHMCLEIRQNNTLEKIRHGVWGFPWGKPTFVPLTWEIYVLLLTEYNTHLLWGHCSSRHQEAHDW